MKCYLDSNDRVIVYSALQLVTMLTRSLGDIGAYVAYVSSPHSAHDEINNPRDSRLTQAARVQMIAAAKSRFEAAKEALALIKRRNDLVTDFNVAAGNYLTAKEEAKRHSTRVRWALEQIPLIEAELKESSIAKISPRSVRGVKRSLEYNENDEATRNRIIKKQRRAAGDSYESGITELGGPHGNGLVARTTERPNSMGNPPSSDHLQRRKRTRNARQPSKTIQPLRRSARIAAREDALQLQTAVARSNAAKSLPRCSRRSTVRATAPPSRTGSQDQQSR